MTEIAAYKDEAYNRGKVPMTKREIRILTIALLGIAPGDIVVDIGAGTGGLTMEAAHAAHDGKVFAVERKKAAQDLIRENAKKFHADNVTVVDGLAPQALSEIAEPLVDKVIVGGSGGEMNAIFEWCDAHLRPHGRIVTNFITLENAVQAKTWLDAHFEDVGIVQIGVSRGETIGGLTMMKAQNPIFIISAEKPGD